MLLTEEQEQVRDTAREFAQRALAPHSAEWDSQAVFPRAALRELGKLGFMGMTVPPGMGRGRHRLRRLCAFARGNRGRRWSRLDDYERS